MIYANYVVKNEEEYLPFALQSIWDTVDHVVIVDNGSTDKTIDIIKSFPQDKITLLHSGDRSFSGLYGMALNVTPKDVWVMRLGADEIFYPGLQQDIKSYIDAWHNAVGFNCWFYHLLRDPWTSYVETYPCARYKKLLLFRNSEGVRLEGEVHERLVGLEGDIVDTDIYFAHYGYCKPQRHTYEKWQHYVCLDLICAINSYAAQTIKKVESGSISPDHILDSTPGYPFEYSHPPVIADYIERAYPKPEVK